MKSTKLVRVAAFSALLAILAIASQTAAFSAAAPATVTAINGVDLAPLMISSAGPPTAADDAGASVSRVDAVAVAARYAGAEAATAQLLHGNAPRVAAEPDRTVWIVVFAVSEDVIAGPVGAEQVVKVQTIGVIVDDQTGAVLRTFAF